MPVLWYRSTYRYPSRITAADPSEGVDVYSCTPMIRRYAAVSVQTPSVKVWSVLEIRHQYTVAFPDEFPLLAKPYQYPSSPSKK